MNFKQLLRPLKYWAVAVIAPCAVALVWTWLVDDIPQQSKWLRTALFSGLVFASLLVWMVCNSHWPERVRRSVLFACLALMILGPTCFRITGVTRDLVPILGWRWKSPRIVSVETQAEVRAGRLDELTNAYPQFLGPNRNGVLPGPALARDWKLIPPVELWRHEVGSAWSGFAVQGPRAVTQEQRGEQEAVVCYDALTGRQLWLHTDSSRYNSTVAGEGPRATPTISGDRVFTIGGDGVLNSLELASGKIIWSKDTLREHGATRPEWGVASSPLVTERAVIVAVEGGHRSLVAYARTTGAVLWVAGTDDAHWSSPARLVLGGVPQIVIFSENVTAHDEQTGVVLWQYPWPNPFPHVSVPLVVPGDRLLISQGYGTGSELLHVEARSNHWHATQVWKSIRLKSTPCAKSVCYPEG